MVDVDAARTAPPVTGIETIAFGEKVFE